MDTGITIHHALARSPDAVEQALTAIFTAEGRPTVFRLEGTFRPVLARLTDPALAAAYRYLILRPHAPAPWTPVLEVGTRTEGLEAELSRALGGTAIFTVYVYGEEVSGYRLAREGALVDEYVSDPTFFSEAEIPASEIARQRGHPARFADLLPSGTAPDDFSRVVLRPGWWEEHDASAPSAPDTAATPRPDPRRDGEAEGDDDEEEWVDEVDRFRCIGLALELWGPSDYPFAQELETLENSTVGPVIALAFQ